MWISCYEKRSHGNKGDPWRGLRPWAEPVPVAGLLFPQLGVLPRTCLCSQLALGLRLCNFQDSDQHLSSSCILGAWGKEGGALGLEAFDSDQQ